MTYYFFPLTADEARDGRLTGYAYALENKDRWITSSDLDTEVNTYDRAVTHIVVEDAVYTIYKDYVNITEGYRVYVGKPSIIGADVIVKSTDSSTE